MTYKKIALANYSYLVLIHDLFILVMDKNQV